MKTLTPWRARISPWQELDEMQDRISRALRAFPSTETAGVSEWIPAIDMDESDAEYTLTAEVPGIAAKDIQMDVEEGILTLSGEKRSEREEKKGKNGRWHVVERSYGAFQRSFTLPASVDAAKIAAESANGVLTVHLPKRTASTPRRIAIGEKK